MKLKIRKGDTVEVISGRAEDKRKRGEILRVDLTAGRVVVQGVNIRRSAPKVYNQLPSSYHIFFSPVRQVFQRSFHQ